MEIKYTQHASNKGNKTIHAVEITHNGKMIRGSMGWIAKIRLPVNAIGEVIPVFKELTEYWATLSNDEQNQLFDLYDRALNMMDEELLRGSVLEKELAPIVQELYKFHDFQRVKDWILFRSNIRIPNDLMTDYVESGDGNSTRNKTYLREEYKDLITFTLMVRSLLPIWGTYIESTNTEIGTDFKEYHAVTLIHDSGYYENPAMERLQAYVTDKIPADFNVESAIMAGLTRDDYPEWLAGMAVVRRLCVAQISSEQDGAAIVKVIHGFVQNRINGNKDTGFMPEIRELKPPGDNGGGEENKFSKQEQYRASQDIAVGEIELIANELVNAFETPLESITRLCRQMCPDIPDSIIVDAHSSLPKMLKDKSYPGQKALARLVLAKVISPYSFSYISHGAVQVAQVVAQAVLWHRGFKDVALLMTAGMMSDGVAVSRSFVTKEQKAILGEYLRFARKDALLLAIEEINNIAGDLESHGWRLRAPSTWLDAVGAQKMYYVPRTLRIAIADISIENFKKGSEDESTK